MKPDPATPQSFIDAATHALKTGDRRTARRYAEQAAALAPQTEQPWLLLAYMAGPKAAPYYLDRARQVNPTSSRVLAAQEWLQKQSIPDPQPTGAHLAGTPALPVPKQPGTARRRASRRWLIWTAGLGVMLVGLATILLWPAAPGAAASQVLGQDIVLARVVQTVLSAGSSPTASLTATAAPSATPTVTRTASVTPTPTASLTASLTPTPEASATPTFTASPAPTSTASVEATSIHTATQTPPKNTPVSSFYSVRPGDTLNLIALRYNVPMQNLIVANNLANPSFIRVGQVLTIPGTGQSPGAATATRVPAVTGPAGQGKEIVVDISEQHLYAYQDNQLVFSFVASTGIGDSTRIGTFKVLDKIPRAYSRAFNIWMPYWMGIYYSGTLENGIHGLPLLMNGVELWGNLLGRPATYGCIESKTSEIKQLYDWAEIGTPVIIRR
jgi:LysM repeat protein